MRKRYCLLLLLLSVLLPWSTTYAQDEKPAQTGFQLAGWHEAVLSVSNLAQYLSFFTDVAGWEVISSGSTDPKLLALWSLPDSASARYALMRNPGTQTGYIRLMQFSGVKTQQIRSNTQSWDSGGIFDLNLRVTDMARKNAQIQALGWQAVSEPVQFSFGPFVVKEWIVRGPDGISFALIERVSPPLEDWPHLKELSRTFNSTQIVPTMAPALSFYQDVLGFKTFLHHRGASKEAGPNVLGLPHNLATQIVREVYILHPQGGNQGSVELLAYEGAEGRNVSALAVPPNLGIMMLRFPTQNLKGLAAHLAQQKTPWVSPVTTTTLAPYGPVDLVATRAPDGAWLEFYESSPAE